MKTMLIDPKVSRVVIFNAGGGIVERGMKVSLNTGINEFQIENVPASFDPNSADIKLEHVNPGDTDAFKLQQTIVARPDINNSNQIIDREKSAANSIISFAIDFTREMREEINSLCEASSYRAYADMTATFNFIINAQRQGEVGVKILYFVNDLRIRWETSLQVNIKEGNAAEIEGFIIVNNQTGFSYEDVDLEFAIFEIPRIAPDTTIANIYDAPAATNAYHENEEQMPQQQANMRQMLKKTQRLKKLM